MDQWSGYPLFHKLSSTTTSSIIKVLSEWFNMLGWQRFIQSDGGPQFRGEFVDFCAKFQIKHKVSSPYNPRANGLAELAVKTVKNMLKKCLEKGKDTDRALYEWRIFPRNTAFLLLLFGRRQRMLLPQWESDFPEGSLLAGLNPCGRTMWTHVTSQQPCRVLAGTALPMGEGRAHQ